MWRAWVGFNFSHSIGVVLFGMLCIGAGFVLGTLVLHAWTLFVLVVIALIYLVVGSSIGFAYRLRVSLLRGCLLIAWLTYTFTVV